MRQFIHTIAGRALAVLAVTGALATSAFADVTPSEGTIGTEFTATFESPLGKKPKIDLRYVEPTAKGPKAKAKVTSVNGGTVTFVIQAAKGSGDFSVSLKGADEQAGTLALRAPRADSADSATVAAGSELVLTGAFFGDDSNKRNAPKVFVNGKKAKTRAFTSTTLTIQVHKKTDAGLASITIQNKVGESSFDGVVTVTTAPKPIKGKDVLKVRTNGKSFSAKGADPDDVDDGSTARSFATFTAGANHLQIGFGGVSGKPPRNFNTHLFSLNTVTGAALGDLTYPITFQAVDGGTYLFGTTKIGNGIPPKINSTSGLWSTSAGGGVKLTLDSFDGQRLSGSFSGSMAKESGDGPATFEFTSGEFVLTVY